MGEYIHSGLVHKDFNQRTKQTSFRIILESSLYFSLIKKPKLGWLYRLLGLANQKYRFDNYYFQCDNQNFIKLLHNDQAALEAVLDILENNIDKLQLNHSQLLILTKDKHADDVKPLVELYKIINKNQKSFEKSDPFLVRSKLMDKLYLALGLCAFVSALKFILKELFFGFSHVDAFQLIPPGLLFATAIACAFFLSSIGLFYKSSRISHIKKSLTYAPFCLLFVGIDLAGMANIYLDFTPSVSITRDVVSKEVKINRRSTTFKVHLAKGPNPYFVELPKILEVNRFIYNQIIPGKPMSLEVKKGFLGIPWFKDIKPLMISNATSIDQIPFKKEQ